MRQRMKLTCLLIGISAGYSTKKCRSYKNAQQKKIECLHHYREHFCPNLFHIQRVLAHIALIFSAAYRPFCFNHRVPWTPFHLVM